MFGININTINKLEGINVNNEHRTTCWFEHKCVANKLELSSEYANICQQYNKSTKWLMFINPDEAAMDQLASFTNIEHCNILCVQIRLTGSANAIEGMRKIQQTLSQGNCSALVLSHDVLTTNEMENLALYASMGETHCTVLENKHITH